MKKRIWMNRVTKEIVSDSGAPLHGERFIAFREGPVCNPEFYQRDVTNEMLSPWKFPDDVGADPSFAENRETGAACCWVELPLVCH